MNHHNTINFKAAALTTDTLRTRAPSIFASGPMLGVSKRYTFVPTARIVEGLQGLDWVPVEVEEQRIRSESRRGFQKHMLRFRRAEQMETLDEWNVELVLLNSHDAGCAYQLHAGIYRRVCSNGLVMSSESFEALRFRHAGLEPEEVVRASLRLMEFIPKVGERIQRFRERTLDSRESLDFAGQALLLQRLRGFRGIVPKNNPHLDAKHHFPSTEAAHARAEFLKADTWRERGGSRWSTDRSWCSGGSGHVGSASESSTNGRAIP